MNDFIEGDVVIVNSGQAGTVIGIGPDLSVLLVNGDIWHGKHGMARYPQDQADLDACPLNVEKPEKH